jgi:5-formyltetrahydrofolate cyclo-ligase
MNKSELRQIYKAKRLALSSNERDEMSLAIANRLIDLSIWDKKFYHLFLTIERLKEIDTSYILHALMGKDKHILISKTHFESNVLTHYLLTDDTKISINKWGIPEPEDGIDIDVKKIDVVFVPLLVADKAGHRVGYGKGFYDQFLAECKSDVLKIGLSFFEPIDFISDISKNDFPLDMLVLPEKVIFFNNNISPEDSSISPI